MKTSKIIYIDTETTGLDPSACDIWQIAALIEINGEVVEELNYKFAPREEASFEPAALKLQDLKKSDLLELPPASEAFLAFQSRLAYYVSKYDKRDKFLPIGYFVRFDIDHLRSFWLKQNDRYFGSFFLSAPFSVEGLAGLATALHGMHFPNFKLATVCTALGIPLDAHDALSDIKATRVLYQALIGLLRGSP